MKSKTLRSYLKTSSLEKDYTLQNCEVVIDGKSLFNEFLYKKSGCQYVYGCECNEYADYLKKRLGIFKKSNVTCYVIFNGAMEANFEFRKKMHDHILKSRGKINTKNVKQGFYDPIFFHDVNAEVLEELGIKYFINEYDPIETIFSVARKFNCPVITNKIDYCIYGVSCIPVNFLHFNKAHKTIKCKIYDKEDCGNHFKLNKDIIPLFITLIDDNSIQITLLSKLFTFQKDNLIPALITWLNSQERENVVNTVIRLMKTEEKIQSFKTTLDKTDQLLTCKNHLAEQYFSQHENYWDISKEDPMWFAKAVSFRRIIVSYVNLVRKDQFSGCWLIYDENKPDAMLVAVDIISYIHCILTNSQRSSFTFIGRRLTETCLWNIERSWSNVSDTVVFETITDRKKLYGRKMFRSKDSFNLFIQETMPGFSHNKLFTLYTDCWLLVIALIYYVNRNRHFVKGAYSVLLSYIVLNSVARGVMILNDESRDLSNDKNLPAHKDCEKVAKSSKSLFELEDYSKFDRSVLHDFAEFQHCLQHMNYLNKICGEKIKCTKLHTTYNGTFIYNVYQIIKDADDPIKELAPYIGRSYVCMWYKKLLVVFDQILKLVITETDRKK